MHLVYIDCDRNPLVSIDELRSQIETLIKFFLKHQFYSKLWTRVFCYLSWEIMEFKQILLVFIYGQTWELKEPKI